MSLELLSEHPAGIGDHTTEDFYKNAEEALALAQNDPSIEVLVTDLMMPGIGGKVLADTLAEIRPALRQIFISGYHPNTLSEEYLRLRHAAFLQKPFPADHVNRLIRRLIEQADSPNDHAHHD